MRKLTAKQNRLVDKRNALMNAIVAGEKKALAHGHTKNFDRLISIVTAIEVEFNYRHKSGK